ncbi:MAG: phosphodiester glycosidase family protein [Cyanobacteria bacterium P01_F01_bin.53]
MKLWPKPLPTLSGLPFTKTLTEILIWVAMVTPLAMYGISSLRRPPRQPVTNQPLFQGITYSRHIENAPRPQVIHILEIDLTEPGLKPFVTPGITGARLNEDEQPTHETLAQRTSHFLQKHQLQVAINANFFYLFWEEAPWNYGPSAGDPVNLVGLAISDTQLVSETDANYPALCFLSQQAEINENGQCPDGTQQAIAGTALILEGSNPTENAQPVPAGQQEKPYPLNIAALNASGTRIWLVLSDGKQPLYSEGTTLPEAAALLQNLGAAIALQLDGGGSTTLAIATDTSPKLLNAVIHTKLPGHERPVANQLGFFANPISP